MAIRDTFTTYNDSIKSESDESTEFVRCFVMFFECFNWIYCLRIAVK